MSIALVLFAVFFLVVGIQRIVEFEAAGISAFQRLFLIPLHVLGCLAFAGAIALMALDPARVHQAWMTALFFFAVFTLFPLHIYVAVKRKIRMRS